MPVSTISTDTPVVTLVNVFTVDPERQEELLAMLEQATEEVIRHLPGFVSANFHRGLDRTKVLNYAQWESREAFEAMFRDPVTREHLEATGRLPQLARAVRAALGAPPLTGPGQPYLGCLPGRAARAENLDHDTQELKIALHATSSPALYELRSVHHP